MPRLAGHDKEGSGMTILGVIPGSTGDLTLYVIPDLIGDLLLASSKRRGYFFAERMY